MDSTKIQANIDAFFTLVKAGLWKGADVNINHNDKVDWDEIYQLAEEQSVVGIVLAGIERLKNANVNLNINQELLLQWIGEVQMLEQQNKAMNHFIAELVERLRKADIYAILVKGQGIAQCYEKPILRACGDVDLLLSDSNYEKAKKFLKPLASEVESERLYAKHLGMTIDNWAVELHGRLTCGLTTGIDKQIDKVQDAVLYGGEVRCWQNGETQVFLPSADNDVIFVFTHFLKHFYKGGLGIRQICDWCRLIWTYRDAINTPILENRLRSAGLMSEWRAFAAFAVEYLGMPVESMPLYSTNKKWANKAKRIMEFVMMSGNFGHNRDSSYNKYPFLRRKFYSLSRRGGDLIRHARIFPLDSFRFLPKIVFDGLVAASKGIG